MNKFDTPLLRATSMEEWRAVEDYPGYEVSNLGRVKGPKSKDLRGCIDDDGYKRVLLCKEKKYKRFLVHRIVGKAFLHNPEGKLTIDHINRDKLDNRVENLRWATNTENLLNRDRATFSTSEPYIYTSYKVCVPGHSQRSFKTFEEALAYKKSLII